MPSSKAFAPKLSNLKDRGDFLVSILLLVLILGSAWQYGGQTHQAQFAILLALGLILAVFRLVNRSSEPQATTIPIPTRICFAICAVSLLQCVALPTELLEILSPGVSSVWEQWIPETLLHEAAQSNDPQLTGLSKALGSRQPATIDPWLTRISLFKPLAFGITLWLSTLVRWETENTKILFLGISFAGCCLVFFGLADLITLSRDLQPELRRRLWITPVGADSPFGVFVNSNNAAGFLHICMAVSIGLLTLTSSDRQSLLRNPLLCRFSKISIAILSIGILGTRCRGAAIALAVAAIVFLIQTKSQRTRFHYLALGFAITLFGIGLLNAIGTGEMFIDRIESVFDGRSLQDPRIPHWKDSLEAAIHFFPMGSGLGTYRYAYLPHQNNGSNGWHVHADGMHMEWLVEGGLWLVALLTWGLIWWFHALRKLRGPFPHAPASSFTTHEKLAVAIRRSLIYLLVTLIITQCFDFAILLPGVFLPLAVLLGILDRCVKRLERPAFQDTPSERRPLLPYSTQKTTFAIASMLLFFFTIFNLRDAAWMDRIESDSRTNRRTGITAWRSFETELSQLERLISSRSKILGTYSGSQHWMLLSSLRIRQQQFIGLQSLRNLTASGHVDPKVLAPKTLTTAVLRQAIHAQRKNESQKSPVDLMLEGQDYDQFLQSRNNAILALLRSPLDDRPRLRLIELDFCSQMARQSSETLYKQALQLRPKNRSLTTYLQTLRSDE